MRQLRVVNSRNQHELGSQISLADTFLSRLRGMLGRPAPMAGQGLLLSPCSSVHMYGMRFPLDVALLDQHGTVIAAYAPLLPWSRTRWHRQAAHALELPAGALTDSGTLVGDVLRWSLEAEVERPAMNQRMETVS
jgi:uncharacterized membrane protein (UPF0127 family)